MNADASDTAERLEAALIAARTRERYRRLLPVPVALDELRDWVADDRQWLGGKPRHWVGLLRDVADGLRAYGPSVSALLELRCDWAIAALDACRSDIASRGNQA